MAEFEGKVALVTGSTRGIGRAVAERLGRDGARVVVTGRSAEAAARVAEALPGEALGLGLDVADPDSVAATVAQTLDAWGRIDILVNNAGITRDNLTLRLKPADWQAVLDTNLTGAFLCAKACLRPMIRARTGAIINISSVVGALGNAGQANYCAAKAGLEGLTRSLAREYANRGVRVNAVAPGYIATDMTAELPENVRENLLAQVPLARLGRPEDVAEAVAFLASDRAAYITGQVLHVNGGMYMG
ncbi:3-oxoacyl-ACP reductase FabG [Deferrisoma camini]|uniref:3-oxoacyl-ACP reductase FabG n=1 Tax=Deferrisoma camini TaxID=1035120 RepID=UPI00046D5FEC|nr:3-oxoacyl-ACP reductase FabG [Deferrisoma camini]